MGILQLAVSTASLDGIYIKQTWIQSCLKGAAVAVSRTQSTSSHRRDYSKNTFWYSVNKNQPSTAWQQSWQASPKSVKLFCITTNFLEQIQQQGSLYDMVAVFLGFTQLVLLLRAWDDYFFACKRAAEWTFLLEAMKYYMKEAVTSTWGWISMPTLQILK